MGKWNRQQKKKKTFAVAKIQSGRYNALRPRNWLNGKNKLIMFSTWTTSNCLQKFKQNWICRYPPPKKKKSQNRGTECGIDKYASLMMKRGKSNNGRKKTLHQETSGDER